MNFFKTGLIITLALGVMATTVCSAGETTSGFLQDTPKGDIESLTEQDYFVDGAAGGAKMFTFSNGSKSLYFIPMIHQAEPAFYEAVAQRVKHLKAKGTDLYYEFIDFDAATLEDKRRIRAILGFLPSPAFYADNVSEGLMAQDNSMFLGFPGGCDKNIDVTAKELADAYEKMIGPLEISEENLTTPIDSFVMPTADNTRVTEVTIDWRNKRLATAINDSPGDVVVLFGAAHATGTLGNLLALDDRWKRVD
jgi:hypothetical protein